MSQFVTRVTSRYLVVATTKAQKVIVDTVDDGVCEDIPDDDERDDCLDEYGDTPYFFSDPKPLPKGTWLIHFTKHAEDIVRNGFKGAHLEHLGLTRGGGKRLEGDHGLAYTLDNPGMGVEFGPGAILFQSDDAVSAYHKGDDEDQVIFDASTMKNLHLIEKQEDNYIVMDKDMRPLFTVKDLTKIPKLLSKRKTSNR